MDKIWWGKTVEYYFVKKYVELDMLIAPLDGNEEKAADAILSNVDSWALIEFKRSDSELSNEYKKFNDYESAKLYFSDSDNHHFLIYGGLDSQGEFQLEAQTYFSRKPTRVADIVYLGIKQSDFFRYLRSFLKFKENIDDTTGSGATYPYVAGVTSDGSITKCMSLNEFSEQLNLQLKLIEKKENTQSYSISHKPRM